MVRYPRGRAGIPESKGVSLLFINLPIITTCYDLYAAGFH